MKPAGVRRGARLGLCGVLAAGLVSAYGVLCFSKEHSETMKKSAHNSSSGKKAGGAKKLTPFQKHVLWEKGTEPPFTGRWLHHKERGVYVTAACRQPVFHSDQKFDSGTGWPSFWAPITSDAVRLEPDDSLGYRRWEVVSSCGEHLGHVFEDGPPPTGLRYCINSAALDFIPQAEWERRQKESNKSPVGRDTKKKTPSSGGTLNPSPGGETR